jgi:hypothetical protein
MAFAVCTSAILLGILAKWSRRRGVKTEWVLAGVLGLSMTAQAALLMGCPLPSRLTWSLIAAAGAATVLSFAILTEYFPKEMSGRANAALNLLHVGIAFLLQTGMGLIIAQWPQSEGTYPAEAHETAMHALIWLEVAALAWFAVAPRRRLPIPSRIRPPSASPYTAGWRLPPATLNFSSRQRQVWHRTRTVAWPFAATSSTLLCLSLVVSLFQAVSQPVVVVHFLEAHVPSLASVFVDVSFQPANRSQLAGPVSRWSIQLGEMSTWQSSVTPKE